MNDSIEIRYDVVNEEIDDIETLESNVSNLVDQLDELQVALQSAFESDAAQYLYSNWNTFVEQINLVKTYMGDVKNWATNAVIEFKGADAKSEDIIAQSQAN
ncbi:MAG: hypothetical protein IJV29_08350 [Butyrivibrio sp.]|nr:hypothetical protein [Butyrivibrio sp.]